MDAAANGILEKLNPKIARWVGAQGWTGLRPIQANAILPVLRGDTDAVLCAPTAGGKTEAAFLPVLSRLADDPDLPGFGALCISPLKSLINDQQRRLEEMARDTGVDITPWHGDVPQSRKAEATRRPSGLLLTTPESLEAMLALKGPWARKAFANLKYVVVDELHAFADSERGKQLQSLLGRIEMLAGRTVPRIGLSATVRDPETAARFLRPDAALPCVFPDSGDAAHSVSLSVKEYVADDTHDPEPLIAAELFSRLRGSNNLIFTNSRKDAEAYTVALGKLSDAAGVPNEFRIHHGSLARTDREAVERDLQRGLTPVNAICTASMELGVDIGRVKSIAQIGTAVSPSTLRQRLGRSGRRGEPSVLRVFSVDEKRDDYKFHLRTNLVQNIAVTELLRERRFDARKPEQAFISVAVQQLLSLLSQYGSFYAPEAYDLLCRRGAFAMLSEADFADLLRSLGRRKVLSQLSSGQLVIGPEGERLLGQRDFFSAFTTPKDYTIVDTATHRSVGSVQYKPYYGEVFILAGRHWIVDSVEERSATVYVSATHSKGKMMFEGTGPEASAEVTRRMKSIYEGTERYPYLDAATATGEQLERARQWFARHDLASDSFVRTGDTLSFFTWAGMRANRTIALMANTQLGINPPYDHIAVTGLDADAVEKLRAYTASLPDLNAGAADLAAGVNRLKKERGKWDAYLPDRLLDVQYAATRLDLPSAAAALSP